MNIAKELLEILVCPETKLEVQPASGELVSEINSKISRGEVTNIGGDKVEENIDSGLIRSDGKVLYPIRRNIPIMLVEEGIPINAS